jgi:hypothetical protein
LLPPDQVRGRNDAGSGSPRSVVARKRAKDYLLLAAERGDVRAMVALAPSPPLDYNHLLRDRDQWQRYLELQVPYL